MEFLIIRPGALGDTLMVLPALVHLRGKASITFVGRRPGLDFIAHYVNRSMDLEGPGWHRLFADNPCEKGLPVLETNQVVAFFKDEEGKIRENLMAFFPQAPIHVFPSFPPEKEKIHAARYLANCLRYAGLPIDPEAAFEKAMKNALLEKSVIHGHGKRIVLHPGSGDTKKNLSPQFWLKLLERFLEEDDFRCFSPTVLLGPAEEAINGFFRDNPPFINRELWSNPSKDLLTQLLSEAALYLGHDSGITHLAAMIGVPTVALFKKYNTCQWRPLGPRVKVILYESKKPGFIAKVIEASRSFQGRL